MDTHHKQLQLHKVRSILHTTHDADKKCNKIRMRHTHQEFMFL